MTEEAKSLHLEGRYSHLDTRVSHLDNRVTRLGEDVSSIKASVDGLVASIRDWREAHKPQPVNWVGIGSLVLAMIVGGGSWVSVRMAPLEHDLGEKHRILISMGEILAERGRYIAQAEQQIKENNEDLSAVWEDIKRVEARLNRLDREVGEGQVSRKAIGDFARDVDRYGSRALLDKESNVCPLQQ